MKRGFYTIMAAQFFSSLADNALLFVAIALLAEINAPDWMTPMLRQVFVISYIFLAAFVGAFADAIPKGRVMLITNTIKIVGCASVLIGVHPLLAYFIVGFGAAAYSPAKYGILAELLPPEKLVMANGWMEGLTVISIILGTVVGGVLINVEISTWLFQYCFPFLESPAIASLMVVIIVYILASAFNLKIPDTGVRYEKQPTHPVELFKGFINSCAVLWRDKIGQISLATTALFWGLVATLQFLVLKWADEILGLTLDKAAFLQGIIAVGVTIGAALVARFVPLKKSFNVLWVGVVMGIAFLSITFVKSVWLAYPILILIGALAGFFVVPMNALLQYRGYILLSSGHSVAVQNLNENVSMLVMLMVYSFMIMLDLDVQTIIIIIGIFATLTMFLVMRWHNANQKKFDSVSLIGKERKQN